MCHVLAGKGRGMVQMKGHVTRGYGSLEGHSYDRAQEVWL